VIFFDVAVSTAVFAFLYLALRFIFSSFAKREIEKSGKVKRKGGTLDIYADAESLEYYIRMALLADPCATIIVNIDKSSSEAEELEYIAALFARRTRGLKIHYIS
jgi:hypothetical protein